MPRKRQSGLKDDGLMRVRRVLEKELAKLWIIDPHTHINPHAAASTTLADIVGYHYYTELAHSAGLSKAEIEEPDLPEHEKFRRIFCALEPITNTVQYSWLEVIIRDLIGYEGKICSKRWQEIYDAGLSAMTDDRWSKRVIKKSRLTAIFLTNDFDDPLTGFDTEFYIPCFRTDELVFHFANPKVQQRIHTASGCEPTSAREYRIALRALLENFVKKNCRAAAISLPPSFTPERVSDSAASKAIAECRKKGLEASDKAKETVAKFAFWTTAELCAEQQPALPFDLMIGVNRKVYPDGVFQGQDLFDSRCSLIQYRELFNAFPEMTFPVSVLTSVANQELASYAWIFPNVVTSGHWWYSNTPSFIEHDLAARLHGVPRTKQLGYYSDMYKLEFALPKFGMYRQILSKVLAERFIRDQGWSEDKALKLGIDVLKLNSESIFCREQ